MAAIGQFSQLGLLLDGIIVLIFILDTVLGVRRGFVRTVYRACKTVVSAAAAFFFAKPLAAILRETPFYTDLLHRIEQTVGDYFSAAFTRAADGAELVFSDGMTAMLSILGHTPEEIREQYSRMAAETGENAAQSLVDYIVTPACESVLTALCFIGLFIVTALVLFLLMKLLSLAVSAPILSQTDKTLGFVIGILLSILHVLLFCMVFDAVAPYIEATKASLDADGVRGAYLYRFFDGFNPFRLLTK